jgi:hypothetical protein
LLFRSFGSVACGLAPPLLRSNSRNSSPIRIEARSLISANCRSASALLGPSRMLAIAPHDLISLPPRRPQHIRQSQEVYGDCHKSSANKSWVYTRFSGFLTRSADFSAVTELGLTFRAGTFEVKLLHPMKFGVLNRKDSNTRIRVDPL